MSTSSQLTSPSGAGNPGTSGASPSDDANAPFLGTPYIIDMQRPYEYPFPSPATESCPSLLLPYAHSMTYAYPQPPSLLLSHPYTSSSSSSASVSTMASVGSGSSLVHRTHPVQSYGTGSASASAHRRDSSLGSYPYPPAITSTPHSSAGAGAAASAPPMSFRPSTLLRRRSSSCREHGPVPALVPVPPRLLARDLPLGSSSVSEGAVNSAGAAGARWRKGRRLNGGAEGLPDK